jgi:hypothetical protein
MDEEDGRPGPQTRKFAAFDVHTDAFTRSLRQTCSISEQQNVFHVFPSRTSDLAQHVLASFANNHNPNQLPRLFWRGPAEGVRPTAGGGEAS